MRAVIIGVAVLVGLALAAFGGLAVFGIGLPQLTAAAPSVTAPASTAPLTRLASNDTTVPALSPFRQLAQSLESELAAPKTTRTESAPANVEPASVAPMRVAQTTLAQNTSNQSAAG